MSDESQVVVGSDENGRVVLEFKGTRIFLTKTEAQVIAHALLDEAHA